MAHRALTMSRVTSEARRGGKKLKGAKAESRGNHSLLHTPIDPLDIGKRCVIYVEIRSRTIGVGIVIELCVKIVVGLGKEGKMA